MSEQARPNFQKLVDYLNQQESPRQALAYMVAILSWGKPPPALLTPGTARQNRLTRLFLPPIIPKIDGGCKHEKRAVKG